MVFGGTRPGQLLAVGNKTTDLVRFLTLVDSQGLVVVIFMFMLKVIATLTTKTAMMKMIIAFAIAITMIKAPTRPSWKTSTF